MRLIENPVFSRFFLCMRLRGFVFRPPRARRRKTLRVVAFACYPLRAPLLSVSALVGKIRTRLKVAEKSATSDTRKKHNRFRDCIFSACKKERRGAVFSILII